MLYRIGVYETMSGYCLIEAKSEKEAKKIAFETLIGDGIEETPEFDIQHREVDVLSSELSS